MPKNKGIYRFFRTREELQRHDEEIRHFTRIFTLEYSRACLDRELKQYTGKFFVPEEERYR